MIRYIVLFRVDDALCKSTLYAHDDKTARNKAKHLCKGFGYKYCGIFRKLKQQPSHSTKD